MRLLRLVLAAIVVLMPNQAQLTFETGIPGVNVVNLAMVVALIAISLNRGGNEALPRTGELTLPLIALIATLVIGFAIAANQQPANLRAYAIDLKEAVFYPLFYLVFRRCRLDLAATRQLVILTMVVAAIAAVQAIRQGLDYGMGAFQETRRASGPFGEDYRMANLAGAYYAMFLPVFVALALFLREQRFWRFAAIAGSAILAFAIMVTYSRQSYLIALVCIALLLARRSMLLALLVGLSMWSMVDRLPDSVTERVVETRQADKVGEAKLDVSTSSRFDIWKGALQMWADRPMGVGLGRFPEEIGHYATAYRNYDAHNFYIRLLAECGPLALLALGWLLWRLARLALIVRRAAAGNGTEALGLGAGFAVCALAMVMTNLYGSRFLEGSVMGGFWILCGLMERYAALQAREATRRTIEPDIGRLAADFGSRFPLTARIFPGRGAGAGQDSSRGG